MKIPDSFKCAQIRAFQDKTATFYPPKQTENIGFGSVTDAPAEEPAATVAVNWRVLDNVEIAEAYGLRVGTDVRLTASSVPDGLQPGWFVVDGSNVYEVKAVIPHDSHYVVLLRRR